MPKQIPTIRCIEKLDVIMRKLDEWSKLHGKDFDDADIVHGAKALLLELKYKLQDLRISYDKETNESR